MNIEKKSMLPYFTSRGRLITSTSNPNLGYISNRVFQPQIARNSDSKTNRFKQYVILSLII